MGDRNALLQNIGKTYQPGEVIFHEGDTGTEMYVIQKGRVRIAKRVPGGDRTLATLGPGEFFGEMAIVNNRPRAAAAIAVDEARLLTIDTGTMERMMRGNAEIMVRMFKKMAARLQEADHQIAVLLVREPSVRVVMGLLRLRESRGKEVSGGIRIDIPYADFCDRLALLPGEVDDVITKLTGAQILTKDDNGFSLLNEDRLNQFLSFLEQRAAKK